MAEIKWYANDTVAAALEEAREWQKPILVDLWHPTCHGCAKLFIDTYQDEGVRAFLAESFVSIKYNTTMPTVWGKRLMASVAHVWHPDLIVLDYRLTQLRRIVGYLPPSDFIAQLQVAAGLMDLFHGLAADAYNSFDRAVRDHPESGAAPEAMYWAGVAAYRVGGGVSALTARWESLAARYPSSEWTRRADCLDVVIPPQGFSMTDPSAIGRCPSLVNAK
jgi:Protein of unknown function, DUF255